MKGNNKMEENKFGFEDEIETKAEVREILHPIEIACVDCGEKFIISPAEQKHYKKLGYMLPKRCANCRNTKNKVEKFICEDCGAEFELTNKEISYYKNNGLQTPKRCKSCLEFKREKNKERG